jgi:hypothetical protein
VTSRRRFVRYDEREHQLDRMIIAAVWKREQAKAGKGHKFELPPSLRKAKA